MFQCIGVVVDNVLDLSSWLSSTVFNIVPTTRAQKESV